MVFENKEIRIRKFETNDIKECADMYSDVFSRPPWNENRPYEASLKVINKNVCKKKFIGLVAEYNRKAAGYLLGYIVKPRFPLHGIYYLSELFVYPEQQNKNLGKKLVKVIMNELKKKSVNRIFLLTKKNTPAEMFYKKLGFSRLPVIASEKLIFYRSVKKATGTECEF